VDPRNTSWLVRNLHALLYIWNIDIPCSGDIQRLGQGWVSSCKDGTLGKLNLTCVEMGMYVICPHLQLGDTVLTLVFWADFAQCVGGGSPPNRTLDWCALWLALDVGEVSTQGSKIVWGARHAGRMRRCRWLIMTNVLIFVCSSQNSQFWLALDCSPGQGEPRRQQQHMTLWKRK